MRLMASRLSFEVRALAIIAGAYAVVAAAMAVEAMLASPDTLDHTLLRLLREPGDPHDPVGPPWLEAFVRDLTGLGSFGLLAIIVLGVSAYLALASRPRDALQIFSIGVAGWLLGQAMKFAIQRPQPDIVPAVVDVYSTSFPSGHALTSAAVYFTLAAAMSQEHPEHTIKTFAFAAAFLLVTAIGLSRVYLGVHWPTDVIGGWLIGAAVALIGKRIAEWQRARVS